MDLKIILRAVTFRLAFKKVLIYQALQEGGSPATPQSWATFPTRIAAKTQGLVCQAERRFGAQILTRLGEVSLTQKVSILCIHERESDAQIGIIGCPADADPQFVVDVKEHLEQKWPVLFIHVEVVPLDQLRQLLKQ